MVDREEVKNRRTEGGRWWKTVQSGVQELERNVRKNICNKFIQYHSRKLVLL